MKKSLITALLLSTFAITSLFAEQAPVKTPLPKVLIIGDSISIGYTPEVIKLLKDKANVQRHKGNAGPTIRAVKNIDKWLGDGQWDIIHFNWGLWDMYGWPYAKDDRSPAMYEQRLEQLLVRLEKTQAKLIWATTTPVCPAPEKTMIKRFKTSVVISAAQEQEYLDAALRVMKKHNVQINDLHALMAPQLKKYAIAPDNVHYTKEGSQKLAQQVAASIEKNLNK
ncbi:SGNH/GDSL hydrolase family protein [Lentisphaera profundi]|uniref:SGNH/GDSL hydrolase family protein n=1 Tax=Lentisphaera profundi TaxID=1658616 RepID=A0ABY7VSG9_9BACT|nr:SGNH/GDSL hydrolase family protein [Lentisphaera profundi]WDE96667.1 SGNH/GDSL hydrolase family protein [Lentisphaera profundi]